jgi:glutathione synthase/RimK-type ligase-like ATP-grasp enzyme
MAILACSRGTLMMPARPPIALVSAQSARGQDADLEPLSAALAACGVAHEVIDWDDPAADWGRYPLALVRSTWDYTSRLPEFRAWIDHVAARTVLLNPPGVLRWNVDKHYLGELARRGLPVVPSEFVEPGDDVEAAVAGFCARHRELELVVKPAVSAGSRDTQRYSRADGDGIHAHVERLLDARRSVLLQPYFDRIDALGETALLHFEGKFSHAIRKGPLLQRGQAPTRALFAAEHITPREPPPDERALALRVLEALPFAMPLYARVDLVRAPDGTPCLLELELTEPSLFFAHAPRGAMGLAEAVRRRLESLPPGA